MIFQATINGRESWRLVLNGAKTQTRRLVHAGNVDNHVTNGYPYHLHLPRRVTHGKRVVYEVGKTYGVQAGRGKPNIWLKRENNQVVVVPPDQVPMLTREREAGGFFELRIRITDIRREDVRQISMADARAEGFNDSEEFLEVWLSMHDKSALKDFESACDLSMVDAFLASRPTDLYDAWALTFEVAHER